MTEPTGETHDSSVELGFSFSRVVATTEVVSVLQDYLFRTDTEVQKFMLQIRAVSELFEKGLPTHAWGIYQELKHSFDIRLLNDAPNYDRIEKQFQALVEEASEAPSAEVHDFIEYINELFLDHPNIISVEDTPSAPTIVKIDAFWNELPLESVSKTLPMQTVVYLSDGTIRECNGERSYIAVEHLPPHIKTAIDQYSTYYYPESAV